MLTHRLADRLCADHDDTTVPLDDGTSAGSATFPQLARQGVQDVYQNGHSGADRVHADASVCFRSWQWSAELSPSFQDGSG